MTVRTRDKRVGRAVAQAIAGVAVGASLLALIEAPAPVRLELPQLGTIMAALSSPQLAVRVVVEVRP